MSGSSKRPNPIDVHVGTRLRLLRVKAKLSQQAIGKMLGLTFQQIQKYEKGTNRIGASRLQQIAAILQVPVAFFFEGAPDPAARSAAMPAAPGPEAAGDLAPESIYGFLATPEGLSLARSFIRIRDSKVRHRIVALVEEIGK